MNLTITTIYFVMLVRTPVDQSLRTPVESNNAKEEATRKQGGVLTLVLPTLPLA